MSKFPPKKKDQVIHIEFGFTEEAWATISAGVCQAAELYLPRSDNRQFLYWLSREIDRKVEILKEL